MPALAALPPVPDLMLSFRHRDTLAQALAALGRRVVAARRSTALAERFAALGAHVLIVDARDAAIEALTAVESVAATVSARGAGLIVLLGDAEAEMAPAFLTAGAHRIIGAPWRDWELTACLLAADSSRRTEETPGSALIGAWHADLLTGAVRIDAVHDDSLTETFGTQGSIRVALRRLDTDTRRRAMAAIRQLRSGASHAVVVQPVAAGRWVHHLAIRATILTGQVELIGAAGERDGPRDPVTGLLRIDAISRALSGDDRSARALALVELGRLARFNDAAGRTAGDALLAAVGRRLNRELSDDLGASTLVARADGARFAILAPVGVSSSRLSVELRAMVSTLAETIDVGRPDSGSVLPDSHVALRVAAGTVTVGQDVDGALAALARRLAAPRATVQSLDVEAALAGEGLRVLFQPQFAFADDALVGAEALVRWQHARLGEVGGAALFGAARTAGLERPLSNAVWQRALAAMAGWSEQAVSIRLALNITAADLADPQMPGHLLAMAADHGVAPTQLTVEVTESAVIDGLDDAAAALRRLRAAGVKVALDDFGSGYSGLSWLKRLPVDYIKIDSAFARDVAGAPRDRAVLAGVLGLARALDLDVLSEGVETPEQYDLLKAAGCRWYQGHIRAAAMPHDQFSSLLSASDHAKAR